MVSVEVEAQPHVKPFRCPVEITLDVLGGKWKAIILYHLIHKGTHRFGRLRRKISGVSERMLTQQLRELEHDGILRRKVYAEVPPKVEYSVTRYGRTLGPIVDAMVAWGRKHTKRTAQDELREEKGRNGEGTF